MALGDAPTPVRAWCQWAPVVWDVVARGDPAGPEAAMATRRWARAAVAAAVGVLLTATSGGAAAVAAPAAPRDGVAAVIASYQARSPSSWPTSTSPAWPWR